MKYFLKIKYAGTLYSGYQVQKNAKTIQGTLCEAISSLVGHKCDITGCSRTDSGVHANCFCLTVSDHNKNALTCSIPASAFAEALNLHLPNDISVFYVSEVSDDFHARYCVKEKTYVYKIFNSKYRDPFFEGYSWHLKKPFLNQTDIDRMNNAAQYIVGSHDFTSFMAANSDIIDKKRTVFECSVVKNQDIIEIKISADGFLYNMVRIIAGTLVGVGTGRFEPQDIVEIINAKDRSRAGVTAPACGLYLHDVKY